MSVYTHCLVPQFSCIWSDVVIIFKCCFSFFNDQSEMWMHHTIFQCDCWVWGEFTGTTFKIVLLFMTNVVRVDQTALSWVAFMIHPLTCATVCLSHLFFCKNSFVKTYSNDCIILKINYIRYPWRTHHKAE